MSHLEVLVVDISHFCWFPRTSYPLLFCLGNGPPWEPLSLRSSPMPGSPSTGASTHPALPVSQRHPQQIPIQRRETWGGRLPWHQSCWWFGSRGTWCSEVAVAARWDSWCRGARSINRGGGAWVGKMGQLSRHNRPVAGLGHCFWKLCPSGLFSSPQASLSINSSAESARVASVVCMESPSVLFFSCNSFLIDLTPNILCSINQHVLGTRNTKNKII